MRLAVDSLIRLDYCVLADVIVAAVELADTLHANRLVVSLSFLSV